MLYDYRVAGWNGTGTEIPAFQFNIFKSRESQLFTTK